jgi:lipopolysaccharide/colanic/teichoic acid biosynthesis glycosyltransferase
MAEQALDIDLWDAAAVQTLVRPAPVPVTPLTPVLVGVPTSSTYDRAVKPLLDVVGALVLSLLTLPIVIVVALAIRFTLGSGVLYRQARVGQDGRIFTMYKFRTMRPDRRCRRASFDGDERRRCHKRDDDPRHTSLGRFLRRSSLDELPQLWNVLRGDMSLVGPRPELVEVVARYEPWQHRRHAVKPGITGLWQVSERAGGLAYEGVHLDIEYLRCRSFRTDCSVLLRTIPVTLRRNGR